MTRLLTLLGFLAALAAASAGESVASPDGRLRVEFALSPDGAPTYRIDYRGQPLVLPSRLGFPDFARDFTLLGVARHRGRGEWTQSLGERRVVPDNFEELVVDLRHASGRLLRVTFRAYDEGAAWRYTLPDQPQTVFAFADGERTEFRFPAGTFGWEAHGTEGEYQRVPVGAIRPYCERPLTLELPGGVWASLLEAGNTTYPRMLLGPAPEAPDALVTQLGGTSSNLARTERFAQPHDPSVRLAAGESTPWRALVVGDRPGDLLERNYLVLNLNPPSALADTAWIRPGKVMRDTTLTTANSKAIIDFAATAGLQYVMLDWKWYGPPEFETVGPVEVRAPNLDIAEIVRYGRTKDVGLILYVDRRQVRRERERVFDLLAEWGVSGAKLGFVDVGPQEETAWITDTIRSAARHRLLLNIHDGYRSTGLSRTWPNLLTVEGIRGNEHFPTAAHNCTLPFTRYVLGAGDYTVCYYEPKLKTTHAHQLAMAVISFSPLQSLFWYDLPSEYAGEPEIEFFRAVPTVWDETRVLDGRIAEYAVVARRSGAAWFVGAINAEAGRTLRLPLDFLDPARRYTAHVYRDDPAAPTATHVAVTTREVGAADVLELALGANGGQAIWLEPRQP